MTDNKERAYRAAMMTRMNAVKRIMKFFLADLIAESKRGFGGYHNTIRARKAAENLIAEFDDVLKDFDDPKWA